MTDDLQRLRWQVEELNYEYSDTLDKLEIERWPDYFTEDALYHVTSKENADAGLPAGLIYCEGKAMLKDRAFALAHTEYFMPRYTQHLVSGIRVRARDQGTVTAEASYLVLETLTDEPTRILQAGKYFDVLRQVDDRLLFKERRCIYHSLLVPNALVFPV
jgi:anthranilate 1,2-dioxygenase small subunit